MPKLVFYVYERYWNLTPLGLDGGGEFQPSPLVTQWELICRKEYG